MEKEIKIFKPRYSAGINFITLGLPGLFFLLICGASVSFSRFSLLFWLFILTLGLFTSLVPFFIIREIRFHKEMVVRRHFLPDYFFSYNDFDQIDENSFIKTGEKHIRLGRIVNLDELKEMSKKWKAAKIIKESRQPPTTQDSFYPQRGYGSYAVFWGFMFSIIILFIQPSLFHLDSRWTFAGLFLGFYYLYAYVIPRYL